jgi:O-antigen ligase
LAYRLASLGDRRESDVATATTPLVRSRLSSTSNNGGIELWKATFKAFRAHPIDGTGAETFEIVFYEHRPGRTSSSTPTRSTSRRSAIWA